MYKINECYSEYITNREAILLGLSNDFITIKFLWKNPDEKIIEALSSAPFFQLYFNNDVMFLLLKFNGLKWLDIPCVFTTNSKHTYYCDLKNIPCKILLFNSNTGKLFLKYKCFMPEGLTKAFIQGIHLQKDLPKKALLERINSIRSSYSAGEMSRLSLGKAK